MKQITVILLISTLCQFAIASEHVYKCPKADGVRLVKLDLEAMFSARENSKLSYETTKTTGPGEALSKSFSTVSCTKERSDDLGKDEIFLVCNKDGGTAAAEGGQTVSRCTSRGCEWQVAFSRLFCEGDEGGGCGASHEDSESCVLVK